MIKRYNTCLNFYFLILLIFTYYFLFLKHQVGNDSTISEWMINYEGGFTKRGIIGQICIEFARFFELNLRLVFLLFQSLICTIYFFLLKNLLSKLKVERILILAIFSPIFILYPIAEIEVLARKEIFVFTLLLIHFLIPKKKYFKTLSLTLFTTISVLIWEPVVFFFPLILIFEIIDNKVNKFNYCFYKILFSFLPSIIISLIFILQPLSVEQHNEMALALKNEFGQNCYMSCRLLRDKSSILQQFQGHYHLYSLEVITRYFLIFLIGFFPLKLLIYNSELKKKDLIIFRYFKNILTPFLICLIPVFLLFAMASDWGRWVNITYVFFALIYFKLLLTNDIVLNLIKLKKGFIYKIKPKTFVIFFIIFCFGWNPKTSIAGDIASFPGYRIPYKVLKSLSN